MFLAKLTKEHSWKIVGVRHVLSNHHNFGGELDKVEAPMLVSLRKPKARLECDLLGKFRASP